MEAIHKFITISFLLIGFSPILLAQTTSFELDRNIGCDQLTVNVTACINCGGATPSYQYEAGGPFVTNPNHTYQTPGTFRIIQRVQVNIGGNTRLDTSSRIVTVLETPEPDFEIAGFCENNQVFLEITDTVYREYIINWGDASPIEILDRQVSTTISHTYSQSRSYSLTVIGNHVPGACGDTSATLINTFDEIALPRVREIRNVVSDASQGRAVFSLQSDPNTRYQLLREGNNGVLAGIFGDGNPVEITADSIPTQGGACFRIRTLDFCGNQAESSDLYCLLSLDVDVADGQNQINWTPYATLDSELRSAFQQYIIYRNGQPFQIITDIAQGSFLDQRVDCNVQYCYEVRAIFQSARFDFESISNEACVLTFSNLSPAPVPRFNSSVESPRSIRLFWELPDSVRAINYELVRLNANDTTEFITNQEAALKTDLLIDAPQCFVLRYLDDCGNFSGISEMTCPAFLSLVSQSNGEITLSWTPYTNAEQSLISYTVQKLDEQGQVYEESPILNTTTYVDRNAVEDRQILRYRVRTQIDLGQSSFSFSNELEVIQRFRIFFPNAFTPNGDNLNDTFKPTFLFVKTYQLRIFSRSGELIYESNQIEEGWDGNINGQSAPQGGYVYAVELEDFQGERFQSKGTLVLIR
ncbi:MAG: gliding motility-associated C-terminal domain-containing protein [Bacteroidota bacterium]